LAVNNRLLSDFQQDVLEAGPGVFRLSVGIKNKAEILAIILEGF